MSSPIFGTYFARFFYFLFFKRVHNQESAFRARLTNPHLHRTGLGESTDGYQTGIPKYNITND
jgi:hypothetical protein